MDPTKPLHRLVCALAIAGAVASRLAWSGAGEAPARTLRIGMPVVTETLDPAHLETMQAGMLTAAIYDTLYVLDPIARPAAIVPLAAAALPEISDNYRTFTIRVRRGILFTPHRAFGGKPRELTAADFAYSMKRVFDPKIRSTSRFLLEGKIEGLDALARRSEGGGGPFDYDAPVAGLAVVDRFTLRIHLNSPDPIFPFVLTSSVFAGVAREAVDIEGESYAQHPVGTGAFVVSEFTPGQRLVLTRNPGYRQMSGEDLLTPASRSAHAVSALRTLRLPGADRIEFSSTPEPSAELLALRRGELDLIYLARPELATRDGRLAPDMAREGLQLVREPQPSGLYLFFSMRDPVVGGNAPGKIALRRAIAMAYDDGEYIRVMDAGFSTIREQIVPPGIEGFVPGYRNPNMFDPVAANALLDRFGYRRGKDGYRRNPDGSALAIPFLTGNSSESRSYAEWTKRQYDRIGLRAAFEFVTAGERVRRMTHCQFGVAGMDWGLDIPDGTNPMSMFWSKAIGGWNMSCYSDPAFDTAYENALVMPPGPARTELFRTMQSRIDAYAPARPRPVGDTLLLKQARVVGPYPSINDWLNVVTLGVTTESMRGTPR